MSLLTVTGGSGTGVDPQAQRRSDLQWLAAQTLGQEAAEWVEDALEAQCDLPPASLATKRVVADLDQHVALRLFGQVSRSFFDAPHPRYQQWLPQEKFDLTELARKLAQYKSSLDTPALQAGIECVLTIADLREQGEFPTLSDLVGMEADLRALAAMSPALVAFLHGAGRPGLADRLADLLRRCLVLADEIDTLLEAEVGSDTEFAAALNQMAWIEYTQQ